MKEFISAVVNLLKVKTLVTLSVMTVFMVLALSGRIESDSAMTVVYTVIAFYFGTQSNKAMTKVGREGGDK